MKVLVCRLRWAAAAVLVSGVATTSLGQSLSQEQKNRLAAIEQLRQRATGTWENPNYSGIVSLTANRARSPDLLRSGAVGTWHENKPNGDFVNQGTWVFRDDETGELRFASRFSTDARLVGEHLLALQARNDRGGLVGDGVILYRRNFDFEGRECRVGVLAPEHQRRIAGTWTHPTIDLLHEVNEQGLWIERRKKGGINSQGTWQFQEDGSYVVELENRWRHRVWPAGANQLAVLTFDPGGALSGDGALLSRR